MKSRQRGRNTSECNVLGVTEFGLWLLFGKSEYYLSHKDFPFFRHAPLVDVMLVEVVSATHLRWPKLDVDLDIDSLSFPERYPLVARTVHNKRLGRTPLTRRRAA
jgi:hypothetical protein